VQTGHNAPVQLRVEYGASCRILLETKLTLGAHE
jgi:hypothetical protein